MGEEGFLIGVQGIEGLPVPISSSSSLDSFLVMDVQSSSSESSTDHELSDSIGTGVLISSSNSSLLEQASKQLPQQQQLDYQSPMLLPAPIRSTVLPAPGLPPAASGRVQHHDIHPDAVGSAAAATVPYSAAATSATTTTTHSSAPEFLYQLTKMLSDHTNRDTIEWSNGRIEVHSPHRLETQVLNKYFRHSKVSRSLQEFVSRSVLASVHLTLHVASQPPQFASFQRQLNYFGFRKLAGKGKMAPCSYVNEGATKELGSLLLIKVRDDGWLAAMFGLSVSSPTWLHVSHAVHFSHTSFLLRHSERCHCCHRNRKKREARGRRGRQHPPRRAALRAKRR
jgi:HSF-type DNA-binding